MNPTLAPDSPTTYAVYKTVVLTQNYVEDSEKLVKGLRKFFGKRLVLDDIFGLGFGADRITAGVFMRADSLADAAFLDQMFETALKTIEL